MIGAMNQLQRPNLPCCAECGEGLIDAGFPPPFAFCVNPRCLALLRGPGPLFFHRVSELDASVPPDVLRAAEQARAQVKAELARAGLRH